MTSDLPISALAKLFATALVCVAGAVVALGVSTWMAAQFEGAQVLAAMAPAARRLGALAAAACSLLAGCAFLLSLWRWHRWQVGRGPSCLLCGGLVVDRAMRYSVYQRCIHCGRRQ